MKYISIGEHYLETDTKYFTPLEIPQLALWQFYMGEGRGGC